MPRTAMPLAPLCALCLSAAPAALAGDLDPPAGPVNPTMKNLLDVEPRRILRNDFDTLTPIVISESGSYYLGEDIQAFPGQHGVEITASNVTLDLNGFTVVGNTEVGSIDGIVVTEPETNIVVRNGGVLAFVDGVDLGAATNCRVENVRVAIFASQGIRAGRDSRVTGCIVEGPGSTGVFLDAGGVVEGCHVRNAATGYTSSGAVVARDCTARDGSSNAFALSTDSHLESCVSENAGGDAFVLSTNSSARGCVAKNAGARGFDIGSDCALDSCMSENAAAEGFYVQFNHVTITRCVAGDGDDIGFNVNADCVLKDCEARENTGEGFLGADRTQIIGCVAVGNGPAGIRLAGQNGLIRGCSSTGNTGFGISVQGSGNLIVGNTVTSGDGYNVGVGNTAGTVQANPSLAGAWDNLNL